MRPRTMRGILRRLVHGSFALGLAGCCCTKGWMCHEGGLKDPGQPPSPNGTSVNAWLEEQATRAEANDFTIYLTEWYMGGTDLGPFGLHHLGDIARRLPEVQFPVVIEPHLDAKLNETRRQLVVTALLNQGIGDAEQRVVVAYPQAEGLYAEEGELVFYDMFLNRSGYGFGYGYGRRYSNIWNYGNGNLGRGFGGFGGGWGGFGGWGGWGGRGFGGIPGGYNAGYFGDGFIR